MGKSMIAKGIFSRQNSNALDSDLGNSPSIDVPQVKLVGSFDEPKNRLVKGGMIKNNSDRFGSHEFFQA